MSNKLGAQILAEVAQTLMDQYDAQVEQAKLEKEELVKSLAYVQTILRALRNPDLLLDGASMTLERLQVLENGDMRVIKPPTPPDPDTCIQSKTGKSGRNGKKDEKELANVSGL